MYEETKKEEEEEEDDDDDDDDSLYLIIMYMRIMVAVCSCNWMDFISPVASLGFSFCLSSISLSLSL